jgi:nitrite reductase (NADH) large subunit
MMEKVVTSWRCTVCDYVHTGTEPPGECPVCGAPAAAFEPHEVFVPPVVKPRIGAWTCTVCGYVHRGPEPPGTCPVCGAPREAFEPREEEPAAASGRTEAAAMADRVVIIGGGIAAVSAAEALRTAAPGAGIVVLSKEDRLPYHRLNLTRYLAGEVAAENLPIHSADWYTERGITLRLGEAAASFDGSRKTVRLGSGEELAWDTLILAAGSHPFVPPVPGASREGVTALRTKDEADRILAAAARGGRCVCIGGGILGLETAGALARRGATVTVIEGFGWLLPRQLDQRAGELLADRVRGIGVDLRLKAKVRELVGDECVRGVELEGAGVLDADLVVLATGVRPNSYLARMVGLEVAGGVVVDDRLRTSHPAIYAAGDVASHRGVVYGTWGPAQFQGTIAGMNAAGGEVEFGGIPRSNTLKVLDVDLFSIGVVTPEDASSEVMSHETSDGHFYRFVIRDNALVGAILLGDTRLTARVKSLVESKADVTDLLRGRSTSRDFLAALGG